MPNFAEEVNRRAEFAGELPRFQARVSVVLDQPVRAYWL